MELSKHEELAALKYWKKQIDGRLDDLEGELKFDLLREHDEKGVDRLPINVAGYVVGKASVTVPKPRACIKPGREDEAIAVLESLGLCEMQPMRGWQDHFVEVGGKAVHRESGELVDSLYFDVDKTPYVRLSGFKDEEITEAFQARGIAAWDALRLEG